MKKTQYKIVKTLDIDAAKNLSRKAGKTPPDDYVVLLGLHKARYERPDMLPELRHESGDWLRARGYGRLTGEPLLPEGQLPYT